MSINRKPVPRGLWLKILRESDFMCVYCGGDANEVDHIIPYVYSQNNKEENLIAACGTCNRLASDKVFESLIEKIGFVQKRRADKNLPPPTITSFYIPPLPESPKQLSPTKRKPKKERSDLPVPVKFNNIKAIRVYLKHISEKNSFEKIGLAYGVNKAIPWKILKKNYEPQTYAVRLAFGLPVRVLVQTVNGYIEPGSISLGSKKCSKCGQPFISNSGKRKLCYRCLKPRDRKAEAIKRLEAQSEKR